MMVYYQFEKYLIMKILADVPRVRTWGCQHSSPARRSSCLTASSTPTSTPSDHYSVRMRSLLIAALECEFSRTYEAVIGQDLVDNIFSFIVPGNFINKKLN